MTKLVVIIGFVVAFAAGLIIGIERQPSVGATSPTTTRPSRGPGWLTSELNLTPQQQEQMKQIWSEVARHGRGEQEDHRRQLRSDRDEAIAALIRPEDKEKYDQIRKNYSDQTAAMDKEMRSRFDEAVKKTKEILTSEQRTKYDEILSRHQPDRGPRGPGGPERGRDRDSTTRRGDVGGATPRPPSPQ